MNKKKRLQIISIILAFVLMGAYFLFHFYSDRQYINKLPSLPGLSNSTVSMTEYISEINAQTVDDPSSENIGILAMVYHSNHFVEEAKTCYELAIKRDPKDWKWYYYLGSINRDLGDSENAIKNFKAVLEINPNAYMAGYYLGEAYLQMDSTPNAEDILKRISIMEKRSFIYKNTKRNSYFPLPVYADLLLSKLYVNINKDDLAEKQLKNLIEGQIAFGPAYRQLSNLYAQKGDQDLSDYYSERSNDLNIYTSPVDTLVDKLCFYSRSETYLLKQIDDAIRSSNSLWALELVTYGVNKVPESKYITSKAVNLFMDMSAMDRALPYLEKHLIAFKNNYEELIKVGMKLADAGNILQATIYFQEAEKAEDDKIKSKVTLAGMYFEKLAMREKALDMMKDLLETHPKNEEVLSGAIFLYLNIGEVEMAKVYLNQLEQLYPSNPDIFIFKGFISKNNGNEEESIPYFENAIKANSEKKFIINSLLEYYQKKSLWKKTMDLYVNALKKYPNDSFLQEAYGSFLISCPDPSLRNLELAKEYSERAFINKVYTLPTRISAGKSLAIAHFELGNKGKALYYISNSIQIAKRARFSEEYILSLESILNDFQRSMELSK